MKYSQLLHLVDDEPLFETSLLVKEGGSPYHAQRRLVDWTKGGKVTRLRRGLYTLPKSHRQVEPHPFVVANRLVPNSYISLEMALRYYNLITVYSTPITTSRSSIVICWEASCYFTAFLSQRTRHLRFVMVSDSAKSACT